MSNEPSKNEILESMRSFEENILESINAFATAVDQRFDGVDQRFEGIDQRLDKMDARFDKMEIAVFNNQDAILNLSKGVKHLEEQHDRTFRRIDDFLVNTKRNGEEIAALRATCDRHEDRLTTAEKKIATA